jgi:hypothetical protein
VTRKGRKELKIRAKRAGEQVGLNRVRKKGRARRNCFGSWALRLGSMPTIIDEDTFVSSCVSTAFLWELPLSSGRLSIAK